ncbi:MAG: RNA polymerase sigma factor [Clostridia bacterium]|nr:RNA polymerase sigma factor [Clostridia bacterium]
MKPKTEFETLLEKHSVAVERYINFRLPTRFDADDVIQETYLAAYSSFSDLEDRELFKPWILSIAKNKCNLWFRKKAQAELVPLDEASDAVSYGDESAIDAESVLQTVPDESAEILRLVIQGYKQSEIAKRLSIPLGTVKSRVHHARKRLQKLYRAEETCIIEKGRKNMNKNNTCGFPLVCPELKIKASDRRFSEFKFADEAFIIPKVGNRNSEGTYRYPDGKLALVSTCYVPKKAMVHGVEGVKVCRDTYNVKKDKLFKNERVWFSQLTDEYIRDLGTICGDAEGDTEFPVEIFTFLEEDYDICVNGKDRVHGRPLLVKKNDPEIADGNIRDAEYNIRYTLGAYDLTVGTRTFETFKLLMVQNDSLVTESFVTGDGRLVLMRCYEALDDVKEAATVEKIRVNGREYFLTEDRISEYAM